MSSKEETQQLLDLWEKRNKEEYSWVKQVIGVVAIILGLIISLKSGASKNMLEYILFISAILSNGLCILCGLIFLYSETDTTHSLAKNYSDSIVRSSFGGNDNKIIIAAPKKIYGTLRKLFFVFLILSVLSLIMFGAYSSLPVCI
jgi:hypothetical protein